MRRSVLLLGAMSAAMVLPAAAADRTISNQVTTAVRTSENPGGAGNLSITDQGSVVINAAGAAVTVDANGTSLDNDGAIRNDAASDAVAVRLFRGITGGLTGAGSFQANGTGANNIGILLDRASNGGAGAFTGTISLDATSTVSVGGRDSMVVLLGAPIVGSVTFGGTMSATGENAFGVRVQDSISGAFSNTGVIVASGTTTFSSALVDPQAASALAIGASLGGLLNDGPADAAEQKTSALLSVVGSRPALHISPTLGAAPSSITIDVLASAPGGYSFVSRGNIIADGNDPGVSATAVRIDGTAALTTSLTGGIYHRGVIRATGTSSSLTAAGAAETATNATAVYIGQNALVPRLDTDGTIFASTVGPAGGTAVGVDIAAGATLSSLTNTSFLTVQAVTTNTANPVTAYAIRDASGTLANVTNSGTLSATGTAATSGRNLFAADLSAATSAVTFVNRGTVTGDIRFGSGASSFTIENPSSGTAVASGQFRATGAGTLDVNVVSGTLRTDSSAVRNLAVGSGGTVEFALNRTNTAAPSTPIISADTANLGADSIVSVTPTSFLPNQGTYVLLRAPGGFTFNGATSGQPVPFLFTGGVVQSGNELQLTLVRKSAAQLGLTGNAALVYEPAAAAAAQDDTFGAALLRLTTAEDVQAAFTTLAPPTTVGVHELTVAISNQATGPIGARQRGMVTQPKQGLGFWAQQFYEDMNASTTARGPSYFASGMGGSVGAEWGALPTGRIGVAYTYFAGQVTERHPRSSKVDVSLHSFSLYGGWRWQDFFLTPQGNAGIGTMTGNRLVQAGSFQRFARADWTSYFASGGVTGGYVFNFGPVQVIPHVAIDGLVLHQTAYGENGGGAGIDLNMGAQQTKSVKLFAGVVAQSAFTFEGGRMQPQVLAGWTRELMDEPQVIDASFEALPNSPFALVGPTTDPSRIVAGASLAYIFDNWSAGVNYDAAQTPGNFSQSATVNITSRF